MEAVQCRRIWWICLRFIVSCFSPVDWPTRTSDKKDLHAKSSPRRRHGMASISLSRLKASVLDCTKAMRLDERRGTGKNTEQSMNLRKKRLEKPCCSCSAKWKLMGQLCSIRRCFSDMVPYGKNTTPGLFRTRFVRCYVLPCTSIKLWRSACKPYRPSASVLGIITGYLSELIYRSCAEVCLWVHNQHIFFRTDHYRPPSVQECCTSKVNLHRRPQITIECKSMLTWKTLYNYLGIIWTFP